MRISGACRAFGRRLFFYVSCNRRLIYFCLTLCYNQRRKHMKSKYLILTNSLFPTIFCSSTLCSESASASIFWRSFYTPKLQISPILKQNRHLMFIPTAMVFAWTSELLMTPIRTIISKCRSKILSAVLVNSTSQAHSLLPGHVGYRYAAKGTRL